MDVETLNLVLPPAFYCIGYVKRIGRVRRPELLDLFEVSGFHEPSNAGASGP